MGSQEKLHSAERKVRFDLNHEVFLIPNKWDRLSKSKASTEKMTEGLSTKSKTKTGNERRGRGRQSRRRAAASKKGIFDCTTEDLDKHNRDTNTRTPTKEKEEPKTLNSPRGSVKLKLSHRPSKELPRVDIVLPKISYTPDLKKAIETALQRSKRPLVGGLDCAKEGGFRHRTRRMSDGSIDTGYNYKEVKEKCPSRQSAEESVNEAKFSDLSQNVQSWSPFPAWKEPRTSPVRRERTKIVSSLIPNSILY